MPQPTDDAYPVEPPVSHWSDLKPVRPASEAICTMREGIENPVEASGKRTWSRPSFTKPTSASTDGSATVARPAQPWEPTARSWSTGTEATRKSETSRSSAIAPLFGPNPCGWPRTAANSSSAMIPSPNATALPPCAVGFVFTSAGSKDLGVADWHAETTERRSPAIAASAARDFSRDSAEFLLREPGIAKVSINRAGQHRQSQGGTGTCDPRYSATSRSDRFPHRVRFMRGAGSW